MKPDGYTSVAPYLVVPDAAAEIDFLVEVFDAEELRRFPASSGGVMHAEVRIDDTVVMLADGGEGWDPAPAHVHVYVADVDTVYQRALEAGARSVQKPIQKGDPDKRGGVESTNRVTWWIATMLG